MRNDLLQILFTTFAFTFITTAGFANEEWTRIHKCSAHLNESESSSLQSVPKPYRKLFTDHMLTLTSVVDGYISFSVPSGYDIAQDSPQAFQVVGSLQQKRAIAYSLEGSSLQYFISTQQYGFGYAEFGSPTVNGGWRLIYLLICS